MMMQPAHSGFTFTRVHDYHQVEFFIIGGARNSVRQVARAETVSGVRELELEGSIGCVCCKVPVGQD